MVETMYVTEVCPSLAKRRTYFCSSWHPFLPPSCLGLALGHNGAEDALIGAVSGGIDEDGEVDARGALGGMAHGLADGRQGHVGTLGDAGPRVARHVGGEAHGERQQLAQYPKLAVDQMQRVLALPRGVMLGTRDDGEEIG